jgi:uncharacterized protein (TIGR03437 family)
MKLPIFILMAVGAGVAQAQSALNLTPSRVVGQPAIQFRSASPNVIEGRSFSSPWAVTVDRASNPPALYVSDFGNNRVLGWRNASTFTNGAAADIVIGQLDMESSLPLGPGTSRTVGLTGPGGLVVDARSNLYVVDSGNNRILRFPRPFEASADLRIPDMVIGQPNFTTREPNFGGISSRTIAISTATTLGRTGLAIDAQGNLWFSDALNNRVLRYPASALTAGTNMPEADIVLGQPDFITNAPLATGAQNRTTKNAMRAPSGLALDSVGRLFVADELGRVLVYTAPYFIGKEASRILGISVVQAGQQPNLEYLLGGAEGVFAIGDRIGVADPALHRILIYDPASEWPAESAEFPSPAARVVLGQTSLRDVRSNRGLAEASENSLSAPLGGFFFNNELFVADSGNHRVLVFPAQTTGAAANRVLGQTGFNFNAANLVEGRELFLFSNFSNQSNISGNFSDGAGVAIDNRGEVPRLYIADTFNNRVLGFADARKVRPGDRADIVIGQNDFNRVLVNAPSNNVDSITESGLFRPSGLAVDRNGDLYVADSGNGRVLRFSAPFTQTPGSGERRRANLVLGQLNFNQRITDASARTMAYPFGLAFTVEGHLLVSDAGHSRILFFRKPADGDFTNGQPAERVIGQPDFFTTGASNAANRMSSPRHIATDTDDRLYVTDAGNNRVLVYDRITTAGNDPGPAFTLTGVTSPQGIFVSPLTGEIWVANTRQGRVTRFPRFERLAIDSRSDYEIPSSVPLALTQDAFGNLYIAEGSNRIAIFFNALSFQINGNYADRPLSPGAIAVLYPRGGGVRFADTKSFNELENPVPMPRELNDIQVLVNDTLAPLYFVSPFQINFLVPMNAPTSGTAEVQVVRRSTGQIIAASNPQFGLVSPALFSASGSGEGQLAALNEDNTVNSPGNPIPVGQVIQLFGTGQGFVAGAPEDGTPPPGPVSTDERPTVIIGTDFVPPENILYSGLAPSLIGVWQINVRITANTAPRSDVDCVVILRSTPTNIGPNNRRLRTTIAVRPAQ